MLPVALIVDGSDMHARAPIMWPTAREMATVLRSMIIEYAPSHAVVMLPIDRDGRYAELMVAAFQNGMTLCQCGSGRRQLDRVADAISDVQKAGGTCVLVSGNRHLAQLVGPNVKLRVPFTDELFDAATVTAHFGVSPHQIPDLFSLAGEKHQGIGMIPARNFLREHKTLQEVCKSVCTAGGKVATQLRTNPDSIRDASRTIEAAKTRVPFPLDVIEVLGDISLPHRSKDLDSSSREDGIQATEENHVRLVDGDDAIQHLIDQMSTTNAISIFVDCNQDGRVDGVGISIAVGTAWYVSAGEAKAMSARRSGHLC